MPTQSANNLTNLSICDKQNEQNLEEFAAQRLLPKKYRRKIFSGDFYFMNYFDKKKVDKKQLNMNLPVPHLQFKLI